MLLSPCVHDLHQHQYVICQWPCQILKAMKRCFLHSAFILRYVLKLRKQKLHILLFLAVTAQSLLLCIAYHSHQYHEMVKLN